MVVTWWIMAFWCSVNFSAKKKATIIDDLEQLYPALHIILGTLLHLVPDINADDCTHAGNPQGYFSTLCVA